MDPGRDASAASPQELLAHAEWVRRLARALVRADDTDDVVQQTWAQALVVPRPSRNLRGWLGAIARNVIRRNARDDATRARLDPRAPPPTHAPDPMQAVARAELHRRVVDTVLALDEPYRSTLVLRFFDEQPADAIARAVGVPIETVRTRVKRGLAQVRAKLGGEFARDGESLVEGLAPLFVPSIGGAAAGAGAAVGVGVAAMSTASKSVIAAAVVVVAAASAWRLTTNDADARRPTDAPLVAADSTAVAARSAATAAEAKREADPLPGRSSAATAATAIAAAPFTIDGRVVDRQGAAVPGATVFLVQHDGGGAIQRSSLVAMASWLLDGSSTPERTWDRSVRTANDGSFRFEGVDAYRSFALEAVEESTGVGASAVIPCRAAEPTLITLEPLVVVRGRVCDAERRSVAKAVAWCEFMMDERLSNRMDSVTLHADGSFCFTADPGPGFRFGAQSDDTRIAESVRLTFAAGEPLQRTAELVLREPENLCTGRIVDPGGAPIDLAKELSARLVDWERSDGGVRELRVGACVGDAPPRRDFTGAGVERFGAVDLHHSTYRVELTPRTNWIALAARGRTLGSVAASLANAGANGPDLVVDLARLPATPSRAAVCVHLFDAESGTALEDPSARLQLAAAHDWQGQVIGTPPSLDPTRRDVAAGVAWFDGVEPGPCLLTVDAEGMTQTRRVFNVEAREPPYAIDVALRRADADVRGVVVDGDGNAVASARVVLYERTDAGLDLKSPKTTKTNAAGRFHIERRARGDALLMILFPPFAPTLIPLKLAPRLDIGVITVGPGGLGGRVDVEVVPKPEESARLEIDALHVERTEDGLPLLDLATSSGAIEWLSTTRCAFDLPPGKATLHLVAGKSRKFSRELDVVAGRTLHVKFE